MKKHLKGFNQFINENVGETIETNEDLNKQLLDASKKGDLSKIEELIKKGADIKTKDNNGKTPLDYNQEKNWSNNQIQEILFEQDPKNLILIKKSGIPIKMSIEKIVGKIRKSDDVDGMFYGNIDDYVIKQKK